MTELELLAPARNTEIGIAAIDCGADAVYMAGPAFGARQAAGNSVDDIRRLCDYAHRFGARIYVTFNTIIYEQELEEAGRLLRELEAAGPDAFIVQDLAVTRLCSGKIPLHASTQCAIRTPEDAAFYEGLGFTRLVLERELSLEQIRAIREATSCELEFFIHGALCVCYSGQCYLSEFLDGRSANRGACIQACRSRYDLMDGSGKTLLRNKAVLSLKDLNLRDRLSDLAGAGICSFKIEGRLKNESYVKNVVREYSMALDCFVEEHPDLYRRASFGRISGGFTPDPAKTFNRGYTELYLDGRKGDWAAMDTPKSVGEPIGTVRAIRPAGRGTVEVTVDLQRSDIRLDNGDGFSFPTADGIAGFRGDVCQGNVIRTRAVPGLAKGSLLYRNISAAFERTLARQACHRLIPATIDLTIEGGMVRAEATSEDGRTASVSTGPARDIARNPQMALDSLRTQLSRSAGDFTFTVGDISTAGDLPMFGAAQINGIRRSLAEKLSAVPCNNRQIQSRPSGSRRPLSRADLSYKANVANSLAKQVWQEAGAAHVDPAYEVAHPAGAELMRTRYCVRHQMGLCPKQTGIPDKSPLYLRNGGKTLALTFDCARCEMSVKAQ